MATMVVIFLRKFVNFEVILLIQLTDKMADLDEAIQQFKRAENPPTIAQLARELGRPRSTVSQHLSGR